MTHPIIERYPDLQGILFGQYQQSQFFIPNDPEQKGFNNFLSLVEEATKEEFPLGAYDRSAIVERAKYVSSEKNKIDTDKIIIREEELIKEAAKLPQDDDDATEFTPKLPDHNNLLENQETYEYPTDVETTPNRTESECIDYTNLTELSKEILEDLSKGTKYENALPQKLIDELAKIMSHDTRKLGEKLKPNEEYYMHGKGILNIDLDFNEQLTLEENFENSIINLERKIYNKELKKKVDQIMGWYPGQLMVSQEDNIEIQKEIEKRYPTQLPTNDTIYNEIAIDYIATKERIKKERKKKKNSKKEKIIKSQEKNSLENKVEEISNENTNQKTSFWKKALYTLLVIASTVGITEFINNYRLKELSNKQEEARKKENNNLYNKIKNEYHLNEAVDNNQYKQINKILTELENLKAKIPELNIEEIKTEIKEEFKPLEELLIATRRDNTQYKEDIRILTDNGATLKQSFENLQKTIKDLPEESKKDQLLQEVEKLIQLYKETHKKFTDEYIKSLVDKTEKKIKEEKQETPSKPEETIIEPPKQETTIEPPKEKSELEKLKERFNKLNK